MLKNRAVSEADREQITAWIAADADHAGRCAPDFWMPSDNQSLCFAVEDERGAIMYVRLERLLRVHIQFAPLGEKRRTVRALDGFLAWLKTDAAKNHYAQVIYESVVEPLIRFTRSRGYRDSKNEHVLDLPKTAK